MSSTPLTRRDFVKASAITAALTGVNQLSGAEKEKKEVKPYVSKYDPNKKNPMPMGQLGTLKVSRLLLGGNLLSGFVHSRGVSYVKPLANFYNTPENRLKALATAEDFGINTLVIHYGRWMDILQEHRRRGGKIKWIMCNTGGKALSHDFINRNIDLGADAMYTWGGSDGKKTEEIAAAVEFAKKQGVPSGVGAHHNSIIERCEQEKVDLDFYIKTLSHPDGGGYHCKEPEKLIKLMKTSTKPLIAFKTMGVGHILPKKAFKYCFENGSDFILAGMFDFEIEEDVGITKDLLAGNLQRERPWYGNTTI